jgi:hypothetical protein
MEKKFIINCYSKWRYVVILVLVLILPGIFSYILFKYRILDINEWILFVFNVLLTLLFFFNFSKYFSKTILEITTDRINYNFEWKNPYLGFKLLPAMSFSISDIKSYKFEPSNHFHLFKIKLKSGQKIVLHQYEWDSNDDFQDFVDYFQRIVKNHNKKKSTVEPIMPEPSIMENKKFLIFLAILITIIFISAIVLISTKGINNPKGILPILIVLGPLIWVISLIVKGLRK